ncbi:MAG: hypothetical protein WDA09_07740, partial [Bacteriovoracaceae bacterium]
MKVQYLVQIENPQNHLVKVTLKFSKEAGKNQLEVFLPSWSPGSYLLREYSRHIRWFRATQSNGEVLFHTQSSKGSYLIDWEKSGLKSPSNEVEVSYEIYCKELTVRTSHVDASHAFLHGPSYLMGIKEVKIENPTIEFRFPPAWSKLSTGLKDISEKRDIFLYEAPDYDTLLDSPVEIGCQETDGFVYKGKPHHIVYYGSLYPHKNDLKKDIKTITETVARHFDEDLPYDEYVFMTHFVPKLYGGLEHLNSTALQFDGRKFNSKKDYQNYLSLVAHEYFHLWNVKRIRPIELGPFDYENENYTSMLWLAEGLTSFMDDLFVFRAGLSTIEEYLDVVKSNLSVYLSTPGRHYHSLEQSSYNAWIKLYRPDENSKNSTVSYYLKGGLVFMCLHSLLLEKKSGVDALIKLLWKDYKERPERGVTKEEVYKMVESLGGSDVLNAFSTMIETTEDIDFDSHLKKMGCEIRYQESDSAWIGADFEYQGDRAIVKTVLTDSPAYKAGLNAGDEILFLNGLRVLRDEASNLSSYLL